MLLKHLIVLITIFKQLTTFNLDTKFPIVYSNPIDYLTNGSYFGYSVLLYPGSKNSAPWIQIGAPKGKKSTFLSSSPGIIFRCGIGEQCHLIDVDLANKLQGDRECVTEFRTNWNGVSMDINYNYERIVVCGHRWTRIKYGYYKDHLMQGACYWSHINTTLFTKLTPLCNKNKDIFTQGLSVYNYGQGQAGISAHLPLKEKELLLGAPGVFNWAGGSVRYKDLEEVSPTASKYIRTRNKRANFDNEFNVLNIASAKFTGKIFSGNIFGYVVNSGYFFDNSTLLYVTSAPKAETSLGQILIYDFQENESLDIKESKTGTQIGEYFGGSLGVGDVNNDGYDDLVVGSPYYSIDKFNEGRIYVYLGSSKKSLQVPESGDVINGKTPQGQFGSAIQYLGDLDHDGYGDFAIGAPYEEDYSGVVYIFRGNKNGLNPSACQRIVGTDILKEIRSFGVSISRPVDIDSNRYVDIAIGAYKSGHTVLLRSSPIVAIHHSIKPLVTHINLNETYFHVEACYWLEIYEDKEKVNISRTIKVDEQLQRAVLNDTNLYQINMSLIVNETQCETIAIRLKKTNFNNFEAITVTLSHELIKENKEKEAVIVSSNITGTDRFCVRCPVYNKFVSSKIETIKIPLALGCQQVSICKSNLQLEPSFVGLRNDNTFVLGSFDYLKLNTTIRNLGENAYLTQLITTLPEAINFRQIPSFCDQINSSAIACFVDNPLKENKMKMISLELDMKNINSGKYEDKFIEIYSEILTSSENSNQNLKKTVINLRREADITITGKSGEQSYYYGGNMTSAKPNFTQIYEVQKFGISPIDQVQIEINIPQKFLINNNNKSIEFIKLYPIIGYLGGQPINCKSNFQYIFEEISFANEFDLNNNNNNNNNEVGLKRKVRQIDVFQDYNLNETHENFEVDITSNSELLFENRTFYINCSMDQVICSKVVCTSGPFKSKQNLALIELKMLFNLTSLKEIMKKDKDIILFSTHGSVTIITPTNFEQSGNKSDTVTVSSLFIGQSLKRIQLWIIILSIILGILFLILIIYGLVKIGFFERTKKDELDELKAQSKAEEEKIINEEIENNTEISDFELKTEENSLYEQKID